jgi:hypothetical protein
LATVIQPAHSTCESGHTTRKLRRNVYGKPSPGGNSGNGVDLEDCKAQFKTAWARTRAGLTEVDIAEALSALRSEPRDRRSLAAPGLAEREREQARAQQHKAGRR